jgi:hypothetical protein
MNESARCRSFPQVGTKIMDGNEANSAPKKQRESRCFFGALDAVFKRRLTPYC